MTEIAELEKAELAEQALLENLKEKINDESSEVLELDN